MLHTHKAGQTTFFSRFQPFLLISNLFQFTIVYIWSQYDGANIEQQTIGYGWRQHQEAKLKIVGEVIPYSNQQEADPTSSYITYFTKIINIKH